MSTKREAKRVLIMLHKRTKPRRVDKAAGTRSKVSKKPWECKAYRDYVKSFPCIVCGCFGVDAHHIRETLPRTMGRRVDDVWCVALCRAHHDYLHKTSKTFWKDVGVDPQFWCATTYNKWHRSKEGRQAIAALKHKD